MNQAEHRPPMLRAFHAALRAVDAAASVSRYCRREGEIVRLANGDSIDLAAFDRIVVVGAGKASAGLALGVEDVFAGRALTGSLVTRDGYTSPGPHTAASPLANLRLVEAGHPLPDRRSVEAADTALRLARSCGTGDLLLCLLSGGASALWAAPPGDVSLEDLRAVTGGLLRSGAPIEEVNIVRKRLSRIAGGRLARASDGARLVTLAISDVIAVPPDIIGSGPTLPDRSTPADAVDVLRRYRITAPPSVSRYLEREIGRDHGATVENHDWRRRSFHIIASVDEALEAAAVSLREEGYDVEIRDRRLCGEAADVGSRIARAARDAHARAASRRALLWGGETTVTVTGAGRGGRNQELALAAAIELDRHPGITIASIATDGSDGPTDAAGGFADDGTVARAAAAGRDPLAALRENDSYDLLDAAGDLIVTGPTGTNVNDLVLALIR